MDLYLAQHSSKKVLCSSSSISRNSARASFLSPPPSFACYLFEFPGAPQVRAMVRNVDDFFPRKSDLGNGPIEVVVGDVLDKVM